MNAPVTDGGSDTDGGWGRVHHLLNGGLLVRSDGLREVARREASLVSFFRASVAHHLRAVTTTSGNMRGLQTVMPRTLHVKTRRGGWYMINMTVIHTKLYLSMAGNLNMWHAKVSTGYTLQIE